jgi:hypothetical protein
MCAHDYKNTKNDRPLAYDYVSVAAAEQPQISGLGFSGLTAE